MQDFTDSYCERCGTRYTFGPPAPKGPSMASARVLARGLKHFVMNDSSTIDDAMAAARIDEERSTAAQVTEEFHRVFSFCMTCRQYACEKCWNPNQSACLSCAPAVGYRTGRARGSPDRAHSGYPRLYGPPRSRKARPPRRTSTRSSGADPPTWPPRTRAAERPVRCVVRRARISRPRISCAPSRSHGGHRTMAGLSGRPARRPPRRRPGKQASLPTSCSSSSLNLTRRPTRSRTSPSPGEAVVRRASGRRTPADSRLRPPTSICRRRCGNRPNSRLRRSCLPSRPRSGAARCWDACAAIARTIPGPALHPRRGRPHRQAEQPTPSPPSPLALPSRARDGARRPSLPNGGRMRRPGRRDRSPGTTGRPRRRRSGVRPRRLPVFRQPSGRSRLSGRSRRPPCRQLRKMPPFADRGSGLDQSPTDWLEASERLPETPHPEEPQPEPAASEAEPAAPRTPPPDSPVREASPAPSSPAPERPGLWPPVGAQWPRRPEPTPPSWPPPEATVAASMAAHDQLEQADQEEAELVSAMWVGIGPTGIGPAARCGSATAARYRSPRRPASAAAAAPTSRADDRAVSRDPRTGRAADRRRGPRREVVAGP